MMVWKDKPISIFDLGFDRAIQIASLGSQGEKGDNSMEEPSFINIPMKIFWDAWNKLKGMPKETA